MYIQYHSVFIDCIADTCQTKLRRMRQDQQQMLGKLEMLDI